MIKIDKNITIKYSKAGVSQYAHFSIVNDKIVNYTFNPSWVNIEDVPSLEGLETIEEVLEVIKEFSYCNSAEIYTINDELPEYYNDNSLKDSVKDSAKAVSEYIENFCLNFFLRTVNPILERNNWKLGYSWCRRPILIENIDGEWNNIKENKESILIDWVCAEFLNEALDLRIKSNVQSEQGDISVNGLIPLITRIDHDKLKEEGIIIEL